MEDNNQLKTSLKLMIYVNKMIKIYLLMTYRKILDALSNKEKCF